MEEKATSDETKHNGSKKNEHRRSRTGSNLTQDEIKKFKESLLQSVPNGESIITDIGLEVSLGQARSRSASRAREALFLPDNVLAELDETKVFELKEAFLLFDLNGDGYIDYNDLRGTLVSLGEQIDEQAIKDMLSEAPNPLDFDAFVTFLGYRTLDLDSEDTLIAALSRWDEDKSGYISEERIRHDLMTWGDRFTEKEAKYALDEAPTIQKGDLTMIDYVRFCSQLSGLKKPLKNTDSE